jgi:hypothetical protein
MNSSDTAMPPPLAAPLLVRQEAPSRRRPFRPRSNRPQRDGKLPYRVRAISIEELDCDPVNIAEIFKEELSYRAQARRFLWEYFD